MWSYYLFMALLVVTLVLWAIIALRDDTRDTGEAPDSKEKAGTKTPQP